MADRAFLAQAMPQLSMGCGVFLQSDIVNQQRKGWQAEEILAALCSILPLNVWIYAGGMNNLDAGGQEIYPAGRHAQESGRGENAGGFHPLQSSRRGSRRASLFRRSGRDRRGARFARLVGKGRPSRSSAAST